MKLQNIAYKFSSFRNILEKMKQFPWLSWYRSRSYSQFWEDRLILRFISSGKGSYVDVGAGTPIWGSNTYWFYRNKWSGVVIDPIRGNIRLHQLIRNKDIRYEALIMNGGEKQTFYELQPWELSTTKQTLAEQRIQNGAKVVDTYDIAVMSLAEIYSKHPLIRPSLLSIDVEGAEMEVLQSNNWKLFKPDIICIEELDNPILGSSVKAFLADCGYSLSCYNGVSSIYTWKNSDYLTIQQSSLS